MKSAHDCSEGGLAVAVAESCIAADPSPLGAKVALDAANATIALFNESQSRVVLSVAPENVAAVQEFLAQAGVPAAKIGEVTIASTLDIAVAGATFAWPLETLRHSWADTIGELMVE